MLDYSGIIRADGFDPKPLSHPLRCGKICSEDFDPSAASRTTVKSRLPRRWRPDRPIREPHPRGVAARFFSNFGALKMQAKRRSPVTAPLLTFALMIGSIVAVTAIAQYFEAHQKASEQTMSSTEQTVSASASDSSH